MPIKNSFSILLFLIVFFEVPALAQYGPKEDSVFQRRISDSVIKMYYNTVGENMQLYNGSEYAGSFSNSIGHPYFESDRLQKGTILYDAVLYHDIPLSYDLVRDELIISNYTRNFNLKLVTEKVIYFSFLNHVFVKIEPDSLVGSSLASGFYELLYNDKLMILAKRVKRLQAGAAEDKPKFIQYDHYFVRENNTLKEIESERELLELFKDQKAEVKKYLHKNNLRFKKDPGNTIVKAAEYYTQLKK